MSNENPYSAPIAEVATAPPEKVIVSDSIWPIARTTFFEWEKLRVVYIVILAIISIAFASSQGRLFSAEFVFVCILGAIFCNACFFAGPIVETYVAWLGFPTKKLRVVLFTIGTSATAVVAMLALYLEFQNTQ